MTAMTKPRLSTQEATFTDFTTLQWGLILSFIDAQQQKAHDLQCDSLHLKSDKVLKFLLPGQF